MPSIDPIVDIYNAISFRYVIPMGGEDMNGYQGTITYGIASFDIM